MFPRTGVSRCCHAFFEQFGSLRQIAAFCAVAMFFAISGYLIPTQVDHGFFNLLKRKLKSLALPYLLWNSLLMLPHLLLPLVAANSSLLPAAKYENLSVWQSIVRTYGLNLEPPIDVPLWFIRNLLLLSLTAPILLWLMRRVPTWLSLGVLFLGSYLTVDCSLWFFAFGMLFRIAKIDHLKFNRLTPPSCKSQAGHAGFFGDWADFRVFPLVSWLFFPFFSAKRGHSRQSHQVSAPGCRAGGSLSRVPADFASPLVGPLSLQRQRKRTLSSALSSCHRPCAICCDR